MRSAPGGWRRDAEPAGEHRRDSLHRIAATSGRLAKRVRRGQALSRSSPEFAAMWSERNIAALGPGTKRFARADRVITFDDVTLAVHAHSDLRMIVYTPATPADAAYLGELLRRGTGAPCSATE